MATIQHVQAPWRKRWKPAMFKNALFHVEQIARASGQRTVLHEYPKKSQPYAEIMGHHALRYQVTGYVIGPFYQAHKHQLIRALEEEEPGELTDPYMPDNSHLGYGQYIRFVCERYSVTEVRERGGYCIFEMVFVEAGKPGNDPVQIDTKSTVVNNSNAVTKSTATATNQAATVLQPGIRPTDTVPTKLPTYVPNNGFAAS